jgi:hypothetical protein
MAFTTEKAAAECISEEALVHLKSYKYSAVDKSPVSNYILKPYVRVLPIPTCRVVPAKRGRHLNEIMVTG